MAIPQLDKANLKGTFFMTAPVAEEHIPRWREASQKGHELGNHTVYHPCLSHIFPMDPHYQAEKYTLENMISEISVMNKMLTAIDGKMKHNFAYSCGEIEAGGKSYIDLWRKAGFVKYIRGVGNPIIQEASKVDPLKVPWMAFSTNGPASEILNFIKQVQEKKAMAILIFHGVGGDYLEASAAAHQEMVNYLKANSKDIWVRTFDETMNFIIKAKE